MVTTVERLVDVNGVRLRVFEAGATDAPLVILAHGFPELAYSWRHQIPALAAAGYHVSPPISAATAAPRARMRSMPTTSPR